ncbi:LuxR family two component transcriptional regulator [Krasilnikovia cinnamomea]|uniref:LuxR family two component transcriptional regulator n=1 Tax=Krasilnikovia cinnamomea TaxID=349313 RepID=A0A4V2G7P7_9ACTN|nr:response regulator transcription factor [Krasilnikovia cinnamomea]RZU53376.1 LuxR family two component transcriptional regulator [Krasilnikovia cinnamomea]
MTERLRVLLVDDHPVVRDGLRWLFESAAGVEVVGEAADGQTAVRLAGDLAPDVVLMDLAMPGMDGLEATRQVKAASPDTAVLVLTMSDNDASLVAAVTAGASGYVLKGAGQEDLLRATRAVADGQAMFGTGVARRLLTLVKAAHPGGGVFPELTVREREVLELMARGQGNAEIAHRLMLSEKTVRNNVSTILTKLHAAHRAQAVARARDAGLGSPNPA